MVAIYLIYLFHLSIRNEKDKVQDLTSPKFLPLVLLGIAIDFIVYYQVIVYLVKSLITQ